MARAAEAFGARRRPFDLEAALIHARNLTEFFWAPTNDMRPHPDGVYAIHYVPPDRWRALMRNVSVRPSQDYSAMCAQLSHISVKRSRRDLRVNFARKVGVLKSDLEEIWSVFKFELEGTRWATTLRRATERWRKTDWAGRSTRRLTSA